MPVLGNLTGLVGRDAIGGLLAVAFSSATIYLWVQGLPVPGELLVVNTVVVQNYINRKDTTVENVEVKLDPPATGKPDDDDNAIA